MTARKADTMIAPAEPVGVTDNSPAERHRAARVVAATARDAEDCLYLLAALGLTPEEGKVALSTPEFS